MSDQVLMQGPIQSGETYPMVRIGGMDLAVKWHFSATYEMSKRGFSLSQLLAQDPKSVATHMELFSILVAPIFRAQNQPAPSADHWASLLGETNEVYLNIVKAINDSYVKANPSVRTATAAPVTTDQPTQTQQ